MKDELLGAIPHQGPNIDPFNYPSVKCDKCGHEVFRQGVIFKKLPGLLMGGGAEDVNYPLPVYVCDKCGEIIKEIREELETGLKETKEKKETKLII